MSRALNWDTDGREWPNRAASRFVTVDRITWQVQQMGEGPVVLLLHGTGGATHSWRGVMPALARDFSVIAMDLPGHGFTRGRPAAGFALEPMAEAVSDLVAHLGVEPALIAGHSAGVAIALQMMAASGRATPICGFGAAISPFPGLASLIFPAMAKMLFVNPLVPRVFSGIARVPGEAGRFLKRSTGSQIDAEGLACYAKLFGNSRHAEGALAMMANWDLDGLQRHLPQVKSPVLLLHAEDDKAVPLGSVERACRRLPNARIEMLQAHGHLAHEVDPEEAADRIRTFAAEQGVSAARHAERQHELDGS